MFILKALRKKAGLKQEEVAELMGVTPNTVSNWETLGKFKKSADLHKLLELYQASQKERAIVLQLVYGDEKSNEYTAASLIDEAAEASNLALTAVREALNILTKVYHDSTLLKELTLKGVEELEIGVDATAEDVNE